MAVRRKFKTSKYVCAKDRAIISLLEDARVLLGALGIDVYLSRGQCTKKRYVSLYSHVS